MGVCRLEFYLFGQSLDDTLCPQFHITTSPIYNVRQFDSLSNDIINRPYVESNNMYDRVGHIHTTAISIYNSTIRYHTSIHTE